MCPQQSGSHGLSPPPVGTLITIDSDMQVVELGGKKVKITKDGVTFLAELTANPDGRIIRGSARVIRGAD